MIAQTKSDFVRMTEKAFADQQDRVRQRKLRQAVKDVGYVPNVVPPFNGASPISVTTDDGSSTGCDPTTWFWAYCGIDHKVASPSAISGVQIPVPNDLIAASADSVGIALEIQEWIDMYISASACASYSISVGITGGGETDIKEMENDGVSAYSAVSKKVDGYVKHWNAYFRRPVWWTPGGNPSGCNVIVQVKTCALNYETDHGVAGIAVSLAPLSIMIK